jgi:hypothetical protein
MGQILFYLLILFFVQWYFKDLNQAKTDILSGQSEVIVSDFYFYLFFLFQKYTIFSFLCSLIYNPLIPFTIRKKQLCDAV